MRKKLLALGMSFLFGTTLIISGCGNSNDGNVSEPTVENTAAPAEDSQSCVTEELKASDQMAWVGLMNNCRARVEEIIMADLIYV